MAARVALLLLIAVSFWTAAPRTASQDQLQLAFDRYDSGDYAGALSGLDLQLTAAALRAAAERWVESGDARDRVRRQRVAAAFTLEVSSSAHRNVAPEILGPAWSPKNRDPWDVPLQDVRSVVLIVAWGCHTIHASDATHRADWAWHFASIALLQDIGASGALFDWEPASESPRLTDELVLRERSAGHLAHARKRFPNEVQWRLVEAVALATRVSWSPYQRPGVLRNHPHQPQALSGVASRFAALSNDPSIGPEARLHLGYLAVQRRQWSDALAHVEGARTLLTEPFLIAVAEYFRGWLFEQMARPADAIVAYRRALELAPGTRNVATLLAAQLFLANERVEAYRILDDAFKAEPEPIDLVVQFERGLARLLPEYLARLREALR
jgi:tetratricopeptide (TPR) repeat protein